MRPFSPFCGTVLKFQFAVCVCAISARPAGTWIRMFLSAGPASISATDTEGSSLSRAASTQPPEPPPTTM